MNTSPSLPSLPSVKNQAASHRFIDDPAIVVTAWQYQRTAPIPVWVARNFHRLHDGSALTGLALDGQLIGCPEQHWIVRLESGSANGRHAVAVVLDPIEFPRCFIPL